MASYGVTSHKELRKELNILQTSFIVHVNHRIYHDGLARSRLTLLWSSDMNNFATMEIHLHKWASNERRVRWKWYQLRLDYYIVNGWIHYTTCWFMMTSSNGNIFRVTVHLCGEFTGHRWIPRTKASDVELWRFFDLHLNKQLSKLSSGWWFETPSHPLWRHCNVLFILTTWLIWQISQRRETNMNALLTCQ